MSQQEQDANNRYNCSRDFSHITDSYMRKKLEKGLIKYDPENWTEVSPMDENKLEGYSK